jgi:hypothetical protein
VKPQWVRCQLGKTIEQPCSDVLAHTPEVCMDAHLYNGFSASKDDHDSWGTCTTSSECKTVIIAVLTVMSGMVWFLVKSWVGLCRSGFTRWLVSHGVTP